MLNHNQFKLLIIRNWTNQAIKNQFELRIGSNRGIGRSKKMYKSEIMDHHTLAGKSIKIHKSKLWITASLPVQSKKEKEILFYKLNSSITAFFTYQGE